VLVQELRFLDALLIKVLLLVVLEVQYDLGAVEGTSFRAKACTCRLPTSVFGHCNPEDRKPGAMVSGVLGRCPAWGREGGPWPQAGRSGPRSPAGPVSSYYAVHQYSAVRRVWGASGVAGFLIFAPPTPPQNLIAGILSTHVRCRAHVPGHCVSSSAHVYLERHIM